MNNTTSSNDQMLEMFLFESTSLLEQLDDVLLASEKNQSVKDDDVAEIFRIMHTIKGSSAMMEFTLISTVTHRLEDLFFYIRDNGLPEEYFTRLFDLVLDATEFLKSQLESIGNGEPLATDNAPLVERAEELLGLLNGSKQSESSPASQPKAVAVPVEPASIEPPAVVAPPTTAPVKSSTDTQAIQSFFIEVFFDEDCGMENLRAFMLVNSLQSMCNILDMDPADIEINADSASYILANGFRVTVETLLSLKELQAIVERFMHVKNAFVSSMSNMPKPTSTLESPLVEEGDLYQLHIRFDDECGMENLRAFMLVNSLRGICNILECSPQDIEKNPASASIIIEDGFLLTVSTNLTKEQLQSALAKSMYVKSAVVTERKSLDGSVIKVSSTPEAAQSQPATGIQVPQPSPEGTSVPQSASKAAPVVAGNKPVKQNLINVSLSKLDELMDILGELVITESMVVRSPDLKDIPKLDHFQKSARQMMKLTSELQDIAMSIRMIPVAGTFHRMQRIVRDMCRNLGKEAELVTMGEDIDLDKTIIDGIADPIMHLVRNSMDHGIEFPAERIAAGKPRKGTVVLSAQNTGGEILVSISDDGKGLDPEKLLNKAKDLGILQKPMNEYTDREAFMLLCAPGFSTKENVTEYSGRGVGMDVVKKNVEKIGGSLHIESKQGQGMITFLKIPLTLAIVEGMEITIGGNIFTLQITAINESFKATQDQIIVDTEGNEMIMLRGNVYPVIRLHELYGISGAITDIEDGILMWVQDGEHSACLLVDELVGEQQIVVKPLPPYLNRFDIKSYGISGCTILGDGNISLILDAASIMQKVLEKR